MTKKKYEGKKKGKIRKTVTGIGAVIKKNFPDDNINSSFNIFEVIIIIFISILFGVVIGYIITYSRNQAYGDTGLSEIITTYNSIKEGYYGEVDENKLSDAAIKGMIDSLDDPYSNYMDSDVSLDFNETVDGSFVGIGVTVQFEGEYNRVIKVNDGGPADKAGVKVDDIILSVDGVDVKGLYGDNLTKLIKGKLGTKVKLSIKRGSNKKKIVIRRGTIEIECVSHKVIDFENSKIGYLSITNFAANSYKQFNRELKLLEKKNIDSLVIDVRGNPGGHLSQVREILSMFFDKKTVLYQVETKNQKKKVYSMNNSKRSLPVAVLINNGSASASEILAAAFKDNYKDALIVGETSYGKGSVQKSRNLSDGTSIKYTTQKWLTSKGKSINEVGVKPTVEVRLNDEYYDNPNYNTDNQLQEALKLLSKK